MMTRSKMRMMLVGLMVVVVVAGALLIRGIVARQDEVHVVAYFGNSNGLYVGDEVRILGVPVGKVDGIATEADRVRVSFSYDDANKVPANANAVVLAPSLVTSRAIQLTPAYTGGPVMQGGTVIPIERTAVPVEWDDFRRQLEKLTDMLQPTQPGGVSTLGAFVNTAADNLRGHGGDIRESILSLSQAISALGDHSGDIFSTVRNISVLITALQDSTDLLRQLNRNLAAVSGVLSNDPDEVGRAVADIDSAIGDVTTFVAENRDTVATTSQKLGDVTTMLNESKYDIEQLLHVAPNAFQNFINIYQPAQGALTGVLAVTNFASPVQFLCSAIEAASKLGAEQSAKLCAQYLAPIVKNRQYNFPPIGEDLFVGATARPNEVTYSEDWLRPDYVPPPTPSAGGVPAAAPAPPDPNAGPLPAEAQPVNPATGLEGMMAPPGGQR